VWVPQVQLEPLHLSLRNIFPFLCCSLSRSIWDLFSTSWVIFVDPWHCFLDVHSPIRSHLWINYSISSHWYRLMQTNMFSSCFLRTKLGLWSSLCDFGLRNVGLTTSFALIWMDLTIRAQDLQSQNFEIYFFIDCSPYNGRIRLSECTREPKKNWSSSSHVTEREFLQRSTILIDLRSTTHNYFEISVFGPFHAQY
jgi:hypothetical protein